MVFFRQFSHAVTPICIYLLLLVRSSVPQPPSNGNTGKVFLGGDNYAVYPQWLIEDEGLCEFIIRTSRLTGFLFYMDGAVTSQDFLYLRLVEGTVTVEIGIGTPQSTLTTQFGENINDNQPHTIIVIHSNKQFEFRLDGTTVARLSYPDIFSTEFHSPVLFGGVPNSYLVQLNSTRSDVNFAGCLQSIQFANSTNASTMLQTRNPVMENGVQSGCLEPCQSIPCGNGGRCIQQWGTGRGYYCDCRGTSQAGSNCSEDSSSFQLTPTTTSYFCYSLLPEPYINEPDTADILLIPPIPDTGTILTGLSVDRYSFFSIYLRNHKLYVEARVGNASHELVSQTMLSSATEYQIQYLRQDAHVGISISSMSQLVESINMTLTDSPQMEFRNVCVGGGLLEVVNYNGTLENVFFRHFALGEPQNFANLEQTLISRSNVIRFTSASETPSSLSFERYNFASQHIRFQFRLLPDRRAGVLLYSQNAEYQFSLAIFNGGLLIISTDRSDVPIVFFVNCENTSVNDGLWHYLSIEKIGGGDTSVLATGLKFTVDNLHICEINGSIFGQRLRSLSATSPLEFGATTEQFVTGGRGVPYIGCMQNMVFERGSETFRPNLETVARAEARFETAGCFYCHGSRMLSCRNSGTCIDRGDPKCDCPSEYTGQLCETQVRQPIPTLPPSLTTSSESTILLTTRVRQPIPTPPPPLPTSTESTILFTSKPTSIPLTITTPTDQSGNIASVGLWVGIAVGGILLGVAIIVISSIVAAACLIHSNRQKGFYDTTENQNGKVSVLHFSASLRQLSSETVTLGEKNGVGAPSADHEREFFM